MAKIAVIYKSKYGFTKKYAQWISEELGADLLKAEQTKPATLQGYDAIIYGGGLYAGGVNGISLITKNFRSICNKKLFLFTVGAADVTDSQNINTIRNALNRVLTPEMQGKIKIYHLRGGMDYDQMNFMHRTMIDMMMKMIRKKQESELRSDDKAMIETYGQKVDFTDRLAITPIIEAIRTETN
ncbi:MAG: flavodoxin domain-containing protein [Velocimicrobium sp.]